MLENLNHSGYINIKKQYPGETESQPPITIIRHTAYDFVNGIITIHAFEDIPPLYGNSFIVGSGYDKTLYLYAFQTQFSKPLAPFFSPSELSTQVDFVIKGYEFESKYSMAIFSFDELQYFCPSNSVVDEQLDKVTFLRQSKTIWEFDFVLMDINCHVSFVLATQGTLGHAHSNMEAISEIRVSFPETDNFSFIDSLYRVVDSAFAFICNRRNTTCVSMKLYGTYPSQTIDNDIIVPCEKKSKSEAFFFDKYRESSESPKVIKKTWNVSSFIKHIDALFQMIANDLCFIKEKEDQVDCGFISISSIHPSTKRRNLIDLQQSLHITGAFEFYVRKYLPPMIEEKDHHIKMKQILEESKEKLDENGKRPSRRFRDLADRLIKAILIEPALEFKILQAYTGYIGKSKKEDGTEYSAEWKSLKECISEDMFPESTIAQLAKEANKWRNELAHSKRSYEPTEDTISAVRLLEHINYAIILRQLGFEDKEIRTILSEALVR